MMLKAPLRNLIAVLIALLPLAYLANVWGNLPEIVPTHFDMHGKPDAYNNKSHVLWLIVIITAASILSYALVVNVHKIDKKRTKGVKPPYLDTLALATVMLLSVIGFVIVGSTYNPEAKLIDKVMLPAMGLFFVFMGNLMYNLKPNGFAGIRVPWTLTNEENWKHTHRLGGKLFFVGGILITLVALFAETAVAVLFLVTVTLLIAVTTTVYSYLFYRKQKKQIDTQ